jgi:hypothetical protein
MNSSWRRPQGKVREEQGRRREGTNGRRGVAVSNIGSDTRSASDVEEGELGDVRVELEEEGQGLSDSS